MTSTARDPDVHGAGESRPPFPTLSAMFDHAAASASDVVALRQADFALTYGQEAGAVHALAHKIASIVAPGDVVAMLLPNAPAFHVCFFAVLRTGAIPALVNPTYPVRQLDPLLRLAAPRLVVCTPALHETLLAWEAPGDRPAILCLAPDLSTRGWDFPARGDLDRPRDLNRPEPAPADVAVIMFTGGTTGVPKAVEHTHARLVASVRRIEWAWPTRSIGEVWLPIAPFTHIYGFLMGVLNPVFGRATVIVPERFKPDHIVDLLVRYRVTVFGGGPPAIYAGLLGAATFANADLPALRVSPAGGAPFPAELMTRWREATGSAIYDAYGMTEMAPIACSNDLTGVRIGSAGKAAPGVDIQIVDVETGDQVLAAGQQGEVKIRGPHMMTGYRGNEEETASTLRHGWIHTGDIGHLDADGFLFITDRKKDIVFVKGYNVFPRHVEEALYGYPKLAAAGVVGVPDTRTAGDRLVAFLVPREGCVIETSHVATFLAERLPSYACPSELRVVDSLPVTGAQKLDRAALRHILAGDSHKPAPR